MKTKPLIILTVVLALAAGLVFWRNQVRERGPAEDPRVGQTVVTADMLESTRRIVLREGDLQVTLEAEGDRWKILEEEGLTAKNAMLRVLTGRFLEGRLIRLVSRNPDRIAQLGIDGPTVTFLDANGREQIHLHIGRRDDEQGTTLLTVGSTEPQAYFADFTLHVEMESARWIEKRLLSFSPNEVAALELGWNGAGKLSFSRDEAGSPWEGSSTGDEETILPDPLGAFLRALGRLEFASHQTTPPGGASAWERRSATVRLFDETEYVILMQRSIPEEDEEEIVVGQILSNRENDPLNPLMERLTFIFPPAAWANFPAHGDFFPAVEEASAEEANEPPEPARGPISVTTEPLSLQGTLPPPRSGEESDPAPADGQEGVTE